MMQRFGALLCMLLGAVMILGGLSGTSDSAAGNVFATCGAIVIGNPAATCPTGTIVFTETTDIAGASPAPNVPSNWTVTITSTCLDPSTGLPVNMTVIVPDGGTKPSDPLYIWSDQSGNTHCSYAYTETPAPLYNATFAPPSPQTIDYNGQGGGNRDVALTNTFVAPTSTTRAPSTTPPPPSSSAASSTPVLVTDSARVSATASSSDSAGAGGLANTGPRRQVRATVWIGSAIFLLGVLMLFLGRRPQGARVRK